MISTCDFLRIVEEDVFLGDVLHMVIYLLLFAIRDDPINSYQDIIVHVKVKGHQYAIIL